jgi:hypothetical protein
MQQEKAIHTYIIFTKTAKKLLPKIGIPAKQREALNVKIGIVTPLIERLATIT